MIRPTVKQLAYLVALENEESFSRAAATCNVTQSTLSAAIRELETLLEQELVNRRGKSISLTPFGKETCLQARKILDDADMIVASAKRHKSPLSGALRMGVIPTIAPFLLPLILPELQNRYPDLDIRLHEDLTARLMEQLEHGRLDAVLMAFPYDLPETVEHTILFKDAFVLASPPDSKLPPKIRLGNIPQDEFLLLEDGHCLRDHILDACHMKPSDKNRQFSATSLPTLLQMVQHGYGVTLLPAMAMTGIRHDFTLSRMTLSQFTDVPAPSRQIGLAWRKKSPYAKDIGEFRKFLGGFLANSLEKAL